MAWRQKGKFTMRHGTRKPGISAFEEPEGLRNHNERQPEAEVISSRLPKDDDSYFDDHDTVSPANQAVESGMANDESGSEDELDAYMAGINQEAKSVSTGSGPKVKRSVYEEEDDQESFFKHLQKVKAEEAAKHVGEEEHDIQYDSDDNPIIPERKEILPLPAIDHTAIAYAQFEKNFYSEHPDISTLDEAKVRELRNQFHMKVSGFNPPRPCISFAHFGFDEALMAHIRKMGFTQPTPIQSQAVSCALSGRDIIGIAKTGSGKTAAYLWPMLIHIMDQPELEPDDGPVGLVCAPTRELSQQVFTEAKRYAKAYGLRVAAVYGGDSKWEQTRALKEGAEIVVATPGRLIDMVKSKAMKMTRITYLVLDEADRMFDMGFEPQVKSIVMNTRPDRQTLLFSATFKKKVERLARAALTDPVRIVIGDVGEANDDITQHVEVLKDPREKWGWLTGRLVEFMSDGKVLIFVGRKDNCAELAENLNKAGFEAGCLHGDVSQGTRNEVIQQFKKKAMPILVATDVAARGLDIPSIKTVINFDMARDIDTHTHRIGRTGRAGEKGTAYTLLTEKDDRLATELVRNLEGANQNVSPALLDLANKNAKFCKDRRGTQRGRGGISGDGRGRGRQMREGSAWGAWRGRGAIGASESATSQPIGRGGSTAVARDRPQPPSFGGGQKRRASEDDEGEGGDPAIGSRSRSEMRKQFMTSFTKSSEDSWSSTTPAAQKQGSGAQRQAPNQSREKKSRWG